MLHKISVISKSGCHLCERAIETLSSLRKKSGNLVFDLEILFLEDDIELHDSYYLKVPVVRLDGKDIFEAEDIALPAECEEKLSKLVLTL